MFIIRRYSPGSAEIHRRLLRFLAAQCNPWRPYPSFLVVEEILCRRFWMGAVEGEFQGCLSSCSNL